MDSRDLADPNTTTSSLVGWVLAQPPEEQVAKADFILTQAIAQAAQHKSASGKGCVLLCGFLTHCAQSETAALRQWARSSAVGERLLTFYLQWNETDQSRSMKLVLDVLVLVLGSNTDEEKETLKEREKLAQEVLNSLVAVVSGSTTRPVAKSAIKMLDHLLGKGVFGLGNVAVAYNQARGTAYDTTLQNTAVWKSLMKDLFGWMKLGHVAAPAGHFAVLLYRLVSEACVGDIFSAITWHSWLSQAVIEDPTLLSPFSNYIYHYLFKTQRQTGIRYLEAVVDSEFGYNEHNHNTSIMFELTILKVGIKTGLVEGPGEGGKHRSGKAITLDMKLLRGAVSHAIPDIRSLALSILVTAASTTKPFSSEVLGLLRSHLAAYFADLDAKFRNEIVVMAKDLYYRLRSAMFNLHKSLDQHTRRGDTKSITEIEPIIAEHKRFFDWYINFLLSELVPTASYQRHVTSLKVLVYILKMETLASKAWGTRDDDLFFFAFGSSWRRALLDLLMDRFEDVRSLASQALDFIFNDSRFQFFVPGRHHAQGPAMPVLREYLTRAGDLATSTGRADHSDGVGRTAELLYKHSPTANQRLSLLVNFVMELDKRIILAETDLARAVVAAPVHGNFSALGQVWNSVAEEHFSAEEQEQLTVLCGTIFQCCKRIWTCVRDILCSDSPEGHLPSDFGNAQTVGTKELLSYSFRAINDSSALMKALVVAGKPNSRPAIGLKPSYELLRDIGGLAFQQLATLRHRGAIGTVGDTFVACCQLVGSMQQPCYTVLLDSWHKDTIGCIYTTASTTRRSAGIPCMVIGLLSANAPHLSFDAIFDELVAITSGPDSNFSPHVHAHNSLREMFRSSIVTGLGNKAERRLSEGLELAASSLHSKVWKIRNCGLLLLRSLIDCLFGTGENKAAIEAGWDGRATRIPHHKYTALPSVLVLLLRNGYKSLSPGLQNTQAAESVFPALDIIRRAGPPDEMRGEIQALVTGYLDSPVWHVREMAGRTLCSCLLHRGWMQVVGDIVRGALKGSNNESADDGHLPRLNHNSLHGAYLALKFVVEKMADVMPEEVDEKMGELQNLLGDAMTTAPSAFRCPEILAAHIEVASALALHCLKQDKTHQAHGFVRATLEKVDPGLVEGRFISCTLRIQLGWLFAYRAVFFDKSLDKVCPLVVATSKVDVNAAAAIIEDVVALSKFLHDDLDGVCETYIEIGKQTEAVEPRVAALIALGNHLDKILKIPSTNIPSRDALAGLWGRIIESYPNPSLADAVVRTSGPILAAARRGANPSLCQLREWGILIANAGREDKTIDSRMASAMAMESFFLHENSPSLATALELILALYDALNDDDDEIRDIAAKAAAPLLKRAYEPIEASNQLLQWLVSSHENKPADAARVLAKTAARRVQQSQSLVRPPSISRTSMLDAPPPLKTSCILQIASRVLAQESALFVVEEKNLFIDKMREAQRWAAVFIDALNLLPTCPPMQDTMVEWSRSGIHDICRIATQGLGSLTSGQDGPLGWSTRPDIFAACAAAVVMGAKLAKAGRGGDVLRPMLVEVQETMEKVGASGLLAQMAADGLE